ncbi:hypothetical protein ABBQ38_005428 [Trebouxia sp. C0009 RCD-2024]
MAETSGAKLWSDQVDEEDIPDETPGPANDKQEETDDIQTITVQDNIYKAAETFEDLHLSPTLLQGLYTEMKFQRPSQIQAKTLPMILKPPFQSLIAQAHNGSGKTTCFTLAMLSRVDENVQQTQALCICPTRELVVQNLEVLQKMSRHTQIQATSTARIDSDGRRNQKIKEQVVIGTHGKLRNWLSKRMLDTSGVKILVFDEADQMLKTDGFASDSTRMIKEVKKGKPDAAVQILLFSATFDDTIRTFANNIVGGTANQVYLRKEQLSLDVIKQCRVRCPTPQDKQKVLREMIFPNCEKLGQTIIFVTTRQNAHTLHRVLEADGFPCTSISGELELDKRDLVIKEFRSGVTKVLIATDVLARGFDVQQVSLVVNFNPPVEKDNRSAAFDTYLHRIGRSGRFGRKGAAFNLVTGPTENAVIDELADYFKIEIPDLPWDDEDKFQELLKEAGLHEDM